MHTAEDIARMETLRGRRAHACSEITTGIGTGTGTGAGTGTGTGCEAGSSISTQ